MTAVRARLSQIPAPVTAGTQGRDGASFWRVRVAVECDHRRVTPGWLAAGLNRSEVLPIDSEADQEFVGGMRVGRLLRSFNATLPLAVLELHPTGLRIRTRGRILRAVAPVWEAGYEELSEVRSVGKIFLFTTGIRFRVPGEENSWAIFWCIRRRRVLQALLDRGIEARADADRLNLLNPGRSARDS